MKEGLALEKDRKTYGRQVYYVRFLYTADYIPARYRLTVSSPALRGLNLLGVLFLACLCMLNYYWSVSQALFSMHGLFQQLFGERSYFFFPASLMGPQPSRNTPEKFKRLFPPANEWIASKGRVYRETMEEKCIKRCVFYTRTCAQTSPTNKGLGWHFKCRLFPVWFVVSLFLEGMLAREMLATVLLG